MSVVSLSGRVHGTGEETVRLGWAVRWVTSRSRQVRSGCFVETSDGAICILSNNHVLANENRSKLGDPILQPGNFDGGSEPNDCVGVLEKSIRLKKKEPNHVDCAIASVEDGVGFNHRRVSGIGQLAGLGATFLDEGTAVAKVGRTTGDTHGRVTAF